MAKFQSALKLMREMDQEVRARTILAAIWEHFDRLDPEYMDLIASLLGRLTPGKMDARLCNALMRVANLSSFEGVWLRETPKDVLQVFLKQRPETGAHAGEWHCPGTIMRASEKSEADVMERLGRTEFGGSPISWVATGDFYPVPDERGTLISHVYIVEPVEEEKAAEGGSWFDVKRLPENMVPHHRKIIADAVEFSEEF